MQTAFPTDQDRDGKFVAGNNARGHKRERIQQLMAEIAAEFEGGLDAMRAADMVVLERACSLLLGRPRSHWDSCRGVNAANRLLGGLRKRLKPRKRAVTTPTMDELLARRVSHAG
jgi:hypothetical protein